MGTMGKRFRKLRRRHRLSVIWYDLRQARREDLSVRDAWARVAKLHGYEVTPVNPSEWKSPSAAPRPRGLDAVRKAVEGYKAVWDRAVLRARAEPRPEDDPPPPDLQPSEGRVVCPRCWGKRG